MTDFSLEDKIQAFGGDPLAMLRTSPSPHYPFPYPPEWNTWAAEQWAWKNTCTLFDQSHHMADVYFKGPDVKALFEATGVNSLANFGRDRAKHFVGVGPDGMFIGDMILFGLEDDVYSLVGGNIIANWVEFIAQRDNYDVEVDVDAPTMFNPTGRRKLWRYQLNGPLTQDVVEKAVGHSLGDVPFFGMTSFEIAGTPVRALNHTMAGVPGDNSTGLELFGPVEFGYPVMAALEAAGAEFGMVRGGSAAYTSTGHESGWLAAPVPAIYTQPEMEGYRRHLPGWGAEATLFLDGSFDPPTIEGYYRDPYDLGYGRIVKFDHDFIGRDALEARRELPHKQKVWLMWDDDDFMRVMRDGLFGEAERPRIVSVPNAFAASQHYDAVTVNDEVIGTSAYGGYTVNIGHVASIAHLDANQATDGNRVVIQWGEPSAGQNRPGAQPRHTLTDIRATVRTTPPAGR